jgi:hypothetical protein
MPSIAISGIGDFQPSGCTSSLYNHALYLEPRAKMMQDWADFLEQTLRGGKLIPFRGNVA